MYTRVAADWYMAVLIVTVAENLSRRSLCSGHVYVVRKICDEALPYLLQARQSRCRYASVVLLHRR